MYVYVGGYEHTESYRGTLSSAQVRGTLHIDYSDVNMLQGETGVMLAPKSSSSVTVSHYSELIPLEHDGHYELEVA